MMINGLLAGLVAITAPSGYVSPASGVVIGAIAGVLVVYAVSFFENVLKVDDPVGAISVHGVCGIWGVCRVGIFADGTANYGGSTAKGALFGDWGQLGAQMIGAGVCIVWAFGASFVFFKMLMTAGLFRSKPEDEIAGLDIPEMGGVAYNWDEEFARGRVADADAGAASRHGGGAGGRRRIDGSYARASARATTRRRPLSSPGAGPPPRTSDATCVATVRRRTAPERTGATVDQSNLLLTIAWCSSPPSSAAPSASASACRPCSASCVVGLLARSGGAPPGHEPSQSLNSLADIGIILLMFIAGLETDVDADAARRQGGVPRRDAAASLLPMAAGVGLGFAFGMGTTEALLPRHRAHGDERRHHGADADRSWASSGRARAARSSPPPSSTT